MSFDFQVEALVISRRNILGHLVRVPRRGRRSLIRDDLLREEVGGRLSAWFTVAVSAADSTGSETDRFRRLRSVSDDTRKTLHRKLKKF